MTRRARCLVVLVVAAATVFLTAGCSGVGQEDADDAVQAGVTVRMVIPDGNLREPDDVCAGAGPYRYAHPEAPYVIQDESGASRGSGMLPQGIAEKVVTMDLGDGRQPTACVMMIDVPGLESVEELSLVVGDRRPVPIRHNGNLGLPEAVLP